MRVVLSRSPTLPSYAIRLHNWSHWHHGGVVVNDDVYEARAKEGVIKTPLKEYLARYSTNKFIEIPHKGDYQERLRNQLGKGYDWGAIFQFIFRQDWDNEDKWFCFELIAYASGIFNKHYIDRVTANHLLMVAREDV